MSDSLPQPIKMPFLTRGTKFLLAIAGIGVSVYIYRLIAGLGSVTNLDNQYPWGLWIAVDVATGVALAAGGFTTAALVHIFHKEKYHAVVRPALLTAMLGYTFVVIGLLADLGRYYNVWHPILPSMWQGNSVLFEVGICVTIYLSVLYIEFVPLAVERFKGRVNLPAPLAFLDGFIEWVLGIMEKTLCRFMSIFIIAGVVLSCLHQSSLGAVYGVLKSRPFWFKPELSVLFMFSGILGGISLTLFASMLSSRLTAKAKVNDGLIERLSHFVGWGLIAYFYFRFWDWLAMTYTYQPGRTEGLDFMTKGPLSFNFWIVEMLFGILIPMVLLLYRKTRTNHFWRMTALFLVVSGVVAYRWDTNLAGLLVIVSYLPGESTVAYTSYTPSFVEWAAGMGIIAYGLLAFSLGVKYLRVVDHRLTDEKHETVKVKATETVPA